MESGKFNRRKFIQRASLATIGAGISANGALAGNRPIVNSSPPSVQEYRRFGKTG